MEIMHNIYGVTFIFITSNILLSTVETGAIGKNDLHNSTYDMLLELSNDKCPYLKTTKLLQPKPTYLGSCSEFSELKSITSITRESGYDISCLLYVNNFILLCNSKIDLQKIIDNKTIDHALEFHNVSSACGILQSTKLIPEFKNGEAITNLFKKPNVCNNICSEITSTAVTPICSLATYTLEILKNITSKPEKNPKTPIISNEEPLKTPKSHLEHPFPPVQEDKAPAAKPNTLEVKPQAVSADTTLNKGENLPPDQTNTQPLDPEKPKPQQQNKKVVEKDQASPDSDGRKISETLPNTGPKKAELVPPAHEETQPLGQSRNGNDQQTGSAEEKHPTVEKVGEKEKPSTVEHDTHQETPVENEEHGKAPEETKPIEQNPKDDKNEDQKGSPQVAPPAKDNANVEHFIQENPDGDDLEFDQDTDADEDSNPPPADADEMGKGDTEIQDTKKTGAEKVKQTIAKPKKTDEDAMVPSFNNSSTDEEDSFFFIYFMMVCAVFILGYIGYHNKQKVLALVIEGRRGRRGSRRGRPNSANYHKLDSNLEEAVTSSCNKNTTNIIY